MASPPFIFFDMDETLIEWRIDWGEVFMQVAAEAGVEVTRNQVEHALQSAFAGPYQRCIQKHRDAKDLHEFWLDYESEILSILGIENNLRQLAQRVIDLIWRPDAIRLYGEVLEVLKTLEANGVSMGIITGRPMASDDLNRFGILHYFDPVIDAFAAGSPKAEGRMFEMAAEAAKNAGRPGWHVGDNYNDDVLGARAAGLRPILVDRNNTQIRVDCPCITDLRAIPQFIMILESSRQRRASRRG